MNRPPFRRLALGVVVALAVVLAWGLFPTSAEAQCAMCRTAFDSPEGRRIIRQYQAGIAFLFSVPIVTFATVAYFAVRGQRKLEAEDGRDSEE